MSDDRAFIYPYTELTGKKKPNETVSFLHHFLDNDVSWTEKFINFHRFLY